MGRPFHRHASGLHVQAALFLSGRVLGSAALVVGILATTQRNLTLLVIAGILLFLCAIVTLVNLIEGNRTSCAVCRAALFGSFRCRKHREARKLIGSYALPVATDVLLLGRYQCPHCNERVVCRGDEQEAGPKRPKPVTAAPQSFPTIRQSSIAAMRQQSLPANSDRETVTKPDESPTLPS